MAEVEVDLVLEPIGWDPYLSVDGARKLDRVRAALKASDTNTAASLARVYRAVPVGAT